MDQERRMLTIPEHILMNLTPRDAVCWMAIRSLPGPHYQQRLAIYGTGGTQAIKRAVDSLLELGYITRGKWTTYIAHEYPVPPEERSPIEEPEKHREKLKPSKYKRGNRSKA